MKNRFVYTIPFLAICVMAIVGCRNQAGKKENRTGTTVEVKSAFESAETFAGTIPCADCSGIEMLLKISSDFQRFELTQTYKGKDDATFVETGKMNTERGFENDGNATVYILNSDKAEKDQFYFVRYSDDSSKIHMLSRDKKRIVSELNYTLNRQ